MKILSVRTLRGPNIWSRRPALEALVDLQLLRDSSSEILPEFNDRLMSWLPGLIEHRCSEGVRGGFHIRLRRGTYLAHILEHVTIELQTLAGTEVGYGRARETSCEGVFKVVVRYVEEEVGKACLNVAHRLCLAAVYDLPFDIAAEVQSLRELVDRICLGPSTRAIVDAARDRQIPVQRLNAGSLVQLGYGAKQRRIWTAETDQTSAIAESIASDKELTKSLLTSAGVPVPQGRVVTDAEDAVSAADDIDGNVVVKPIDANHGRGVFMDLREPGLIRTAYEAAAKEGSGVIVEQYIPGHEHRLLVIGGKLIAAARGEAASVVGDGLHTISELVDLQINSDPRRGDEESCPLNPVLLDALTLTELSNQGYQPDQILADGTRVLVRRNDNLSEDVTDIVHPSVAEHAVIAASVVGLDIAGIDLVATDISRPLEAQGGAIVEVNAGPGLLPHLRPRVGQPRPVGKAIVETLFPAGSTGRIPIVSVTGTNGKTTTTRLVAALLERAGYRVGMTCSDGIFVGTRLIDQGDCAGPQSARKVLMNPAVEAAVLECARGGILREGLGFDHCDVAIVTNIRTADHLGQHDLHTPADMYKVKRTPVDVVLPTGVAVLNADDPLVAQMAELSAGDVVFFARDAEHSVVRKHLLAGRRAVTVRNGTILLSQGLQEHPLMPMDQVPCTHGGRINFQVENVLAAVAAAWSLGIPNSVMQMTLQSFQGNHIDNPGRFTVLEIQNRTVIAFDGRNALALHSLIDACQAFSHQQRSIVYSGEGDRRDEDLITQGQLLGDHFDAITLCEIDRHDPRPSGDVMRLLQQGLNSGSRFAQCTLQADWSQAVDAAWTELPPRGLLVIQAASITQTVQKLQQLSGHEPTVPTGRTLHAVG
ncbi:cyanophycin synthetase [bacterium]|nr:cyanophycin synthetase [bacterium]